MYNFTESNPQVYTPCLKTVQICFVRTLTTCESDKATTRVVQANDDRRFLALIIAKNDRRRSRHQRVLFTDTRRTDELGYHQFLPRDAMLARY